VLFFKPTTELTVSWINIFFIRSINVKEIAIRNYLEVWPTWIIRQTSKITGEQIINLKVSIPYLASLQTLS